MMDSDRRQTLLARSKNMTAILVRHPGGVAFQPPQTLLRASDAAAVGRGSATGPLRRHALGFTSIARPQRSRSSYSPVLVSISPAATARVSNSKSRSIWSA
jgi:hypothetical protein